MHRQQHNNGVLLPLLQPNSSAPRSTSRRVPLLWFSRRGWLQPSRPAVQHARLTAQKPSVPEKRFLRPVITTEGSVHTPVPL